MNKSFFTTIIFFFVGLICFSQHTIIMKSGEKIKGVVMEIQYDTITFVIGPNFKSTKIPLKNVSSIFFNEYIAYNGELLKNDKIKTARSGNYTINYVLKDRKMTIIPKISIGTEDKGSVVVLITVDRYGNVVSAEPGYVGSTTSNKYLYAKAKFAAQEAKFDESPLGPLKTKGIMTITY